MPDETTPSATPAATTTTTPEATPATKPTETATPEKTETTTPEPTKEEAEAPEPEESDSETDSPEEEPLSLSSENLEKIKSSPELRAVYKEMTRGLTRKFQAIASDAALIQAIKENPKEAAIAIAEAAGLKIQQEELPAPGKKATDAVLAELESAVGPEIAKALKPAFETLAKNLIAAEIAPVKELAEASRQEQLTARSQADVATFKARHQGEITKKVEQEMVALSQKIEPKDGVDPVEYMEMLYTIATAKKGKTEVTAEVVKRMATAAATVEPTSGLVATKVEPTLSLKGKTFDQALDAAFEEAKRRHVG